MRGSHPALEHISHRPWPLPPRPWRWRQAWLDAAFLHYRVEAGRLRSLIPPSLEVEEFDGTAWVGLVPFRMAGVARRPLPSPPCVTAFLELNLRTYVRLGDRPGVWFFSLDANSRIAVAGGRAVYGLPYFAAVMEQRQRDGWLEFESRRHGGGGTFRAAYRASGGLIGTGGDAFGRWATERYCLYRWDRRRGLGRVEVHHAPWPLQPSEAVIAECDLLHAAGIDVADESPVCHFSTGVSAISFGLERAGPAIPPAG